MRKFMWNEFLIDCGDVIGGFIAGIGSQDKEHSAMLIFGLLLIVVSTALKVNKYRVNHDNT